MTIRLSITLFLLSMTTLAQAVEPVTQAQINEVVTKVMQEKHIPGLSIAVSMPGGKYRGKLWSCQCGIPATR